MPDKTGPAAINMARDLCLRLIERRALAPGQVAAAMALLAVAAQNALDAAGDGDGLWLARLGRDLTLKMIERGFLASPADAAAALGQNTRLAAETAALLPPGTRAAALNAAKDLTLKMAETGRLSKTGLAGLFREIATGL